MSHAIVTGLSAILSGSIAFDLRLDAMKNIGRRWIPWY